MRFRAAVDADADQHGPTPVHRRAAVPVAADAQPGRRAHRAHVADRARRVHARAVLVPRAARPGRHGEHMHAGVPQERHVPHVDRVHRVRRVAVVPVAAVAVRLLLPADIPQAEQDAPAHRSVERAPVQGPAAEQPVAGAAGRDRHQLLVPGKEPPANGGIASVRPGFSLRSFRVVSCNSKNGKRVARRWRPANAYAPVSIRT